MNTARSTNLKPLVDAAPRSRAGGNFHWGDNEILDDHLTEIGTQGYLLYMLLGRHSRNGQISMSYSQLSKLSRLSMSTTKRYMTILIAMGFITTQKMLGDTNTYIMNRLPRKLHIVTEDPAQMSLALTLSKVPPPVIVHSEPPQCHSEPPQCHREPPLVSQRTMHNRSKSSSQEVLQDCKPRERIVPLHSVRGGPFVSTDERHEKIKSIIIKWHSVIMKIPADLTWDKDADRVLAKVLRDNQALTVELATRSIKNFYRSDVELKRPSQGVIPKMLDFLGGEKTQFGHPRKMDKDYRESNVGCA